MKARIAFRAICTGLMVFIASAWPASAATRRVVLLFGERPELPALAALQADLVRTLTSNSADRIEIYNETMDLSRFGWNNHQLFLRDFLQAKYADKKIDVVISILSPALEFLLNYGSVIFPGTPIVFCGIDKTELGNRLLPSQVRGVLLKREFAPTVEIALHLHPGTEHAVVVAGSSDFDTKLLELAKIDFGFYQERFNFQYLTTLPLQDLLTELSHLPPRSLVFYTTVFRDGAGETLIPREVVGRVSAAANAPTYGFFEQYVGRGIIGGNVNSLAAHGVEAAKLALKVLAGTEASTPQVAEVSTNKLVFDWRQLQRWGISESKLPSGSEIWFRGSSAWDQYKPPNFSDHSCNLAAGRAHRLAAPRTSISPPRGTDGAGDFCGAYAHEPNGDGRRALSRHCSRSQTTYYRHGNDGQRGLTLAFKRESRYRPGPGCNEQGCCGRSSGKRRNYERLRAIRDGSRPRF